MPKKRNIKITLRSVVFMMIISGGLITGCSTKSHAQKERKIRLQNSSQFKDGKFVNPIDAPTIAPGSTWELIKKYTIIPRVDPKPETVLPIEPIQQKDWVGLNEQELFFAWLGHSSVLIALDGKTILVDPVFEKRASPFSWIGPKRFHPAPATVKEMPFIDIVLITHDHYDHLEKPTIKQLNLKTRLFLVPLGIGNLREEWGVDPEKIVALDWWEHHHVGPLNFTAAPAIHYAKRGLFDGNKRLWCSWSIQGQKRNLFISGDSGYFDGFKEIGDKLGPFDLTLLKIGAYDDLWKQIHMMPEEAVQQHLDLRGNLLVPLHWATFDLALHPWYEPIERMMTACEKQKVNFITPSIGQKINLEQLPETPFWWQKFYKKND